MAARQRIGIKAVEGLELRSINWDATVTGFGARRQTGPGVAYVVTYRTAEGRPRMQTIGRHGAPWTPDTAREEARRILGDVAKGMDPAAAKREKREAPTVAELCAVYMKEAEAGRLLTRRGAAKKPATVDTDRSRIDCHIIPLIGTTKVAAVTSRDVEKLMHDIAAGKTHKREKLDKAHALSHVRAGKGGASRVIGLLGAIFAFAVKRGWRDDNPVRGVTRYADQRRERRLSGDEYAALGEALRNLEQVSRSPDGKPASAALWPPAASAIRFLALTGWRRGEALALRWQDVDLATRTARLPDTKTGASVRPLSRRACDVLKAIPRGMTDLVFPPSRGTVAMSGFPGFLTRVVKEADLPSDVTAHVLRHSFASMAADGGASEFTVAALLGHRAGSVTSRYVHAADAVLLAAADRVAESIAEAMGEAAPIASVVSIVGRA
ncbi:MAG: tyrosine-type recombinase/integrase [Deltaproteobacteria bacterium]